MTNVSHETIMVIEHLLNSLRHAIECAPDLPDFVHAYHRHSGCQISLGHLFDTFLQPAQRSELRQLNNVGDSDNYQQTSDQTPQTGAYATPAAG